jgi:hypothetical protein
MDDLAAELLRDDPALRQGIQGPEPDQHQGEGPKGGEYFGSNPWTNVPKFMPSGGLPGLWLVPLHLEQN